MGSRSPFKQTLALILAAALGLGQAVPARGEEQKPQAPAPQSPPPNTDSGPSLSESLKANDPDNAELALHNALVAINKGQMDAQDLLKVINGLTRDQKKALFKLSTDAQQALRNLIEDQGDDALLSELQKLREEQTTQDSPPETADGANTGAGKDGAGKDASPDEVRAKLKDRVDLPVEQKKIAANQPKSGPDTGSEQPGNAKPSLTAAAQPPGTAKGGKPRSPTPGPVLPENFKRDVDLSVPAAASKEPDPEVMKGFARELERFIDGPDLVDKIRPHEAGRLLDAIDEYLLGRDIQAKPTGKPVSPEIREMLTRARAEADRVASSYRERDRYIARNAEGLRARIDEMIKALPPTPAPKRELANALSSWLSSPEGKRSLSAAGAWLSAAFDGARRWALETLVPAALSPADRLNPRALIPPSDAGAPGPAAKALAAVETALKLDALASLGGQGLRLQLPLAVLAAQESADPLGVLPRAAPATRHAALDASQRQAVAGLLGAMERYYQNARLDAGRPEQRAELDRRLEDLARLKELSAKGGLTFPELLTRLGVGGKEQAELAKSLQARFDGQNALHGKEAFIEALFESAPKLRGQLKALREAQMDADLKAERAVVDLRAGKLPQGYADFERALAQLGVAGPTQDPKLREALTELLLASWIAGGKPALARPEGMSEADFAKLKSAYEALAAEHARDPKAFLGLKIDQARETLAGLQTNAFLNRAAYERFLGAVGTPSERERFFAETGLTERLEQMKALRESLARSAAAAPGDSAAARALARVEAGIAAVEALFARDARGAERDPSLRAAFFSAYRAAGFRVLEPAAGGPRLAGRDGLPAAEIPPQFMEALAKASDEAQGMTPKLTSWRDKVSGEGAFYALLEAYDKAGAIPEAPGLTEGEKEYRRQYGATIEDVREFLRSLKARGEASPERQLADIAKLAELARMHQTGAALAWGRERAESAQRRFYESLQKKGFAKEIAAFLAAAADQERGLDGAFPGWRSLAPDLAARLETAAAATELFQSSNRMDLPALLDAGKTLRPGQLGLPDSVLKVEAARGPKGERGVAKLMQLDKAKGITLEHFESFGGGVHRLVYRQNGQEIGAVALSGVADPRFTGGLVAALGQGGTLTVGGRTFVKNAAGELEAKGFPLPNGMSFTGAVRFDEATLQVIPWSGTASGAPGGDALSERWQGGRPVSGDSRSAGEYAYETRQVYRTPEDERYANKSPITVKVSRRHEGSIIEAVVPVPDPKEPGKTMPGQYYSYLDEDGRLRDTPQKLLLTGEAAERHRNGYNYLGGDYLQHNAVRALFDRRDGELSLRVIEIPNPWWSGTRPEKVHVYQAGKLREIVTVAPERAFEQPGRESKDAAIGKVAVTERYYPDSAWTDKLKEPGSRWQTDRIHRLVASQYVATGVHDLTYIETDKSWDPAKGPQMHRVTKYRVNSAGERTLIYEAVFARGRNGEPVASIRRSDKTQIKGYDEREAAERPYAEDAQAAAAAYKKSLEGENGWDRAKALGAASLGKVTALADILVGLTELSLGSAAELTDASLRLATGRPQAKHGEWTLGSAMIFQGGEMLVANDLTKNVADLVSPGSARQTYADFLSQHFQVDKYGEVQATTEWGAQYLADWKRNPATAKIAPTWENFTSPQFRTTLSGAIENAFAKAQQASGRERAALLALGGTAYAAKTGLDVMFLGEAMTPLRLAQAGMLARARLIQDPGLRFLGVAGARSAGGAITVAETYALRAGFVSEMGHELSLLVSDPENRDIHGAKLAATVAGMVVARMPKEGARVKEAGGGFGAQLRLAGNIAGQEAAMMTAAGLVAQALEKSGLDPMAAGTLAALGYSGLVQPGVEKLLPGGEGVAARVLEARRAAAAAGQPKLVDALPAKLEGKSRPPVDALPKGAAGLWTRVTDAVGSWLGRPSSAQLDNAQSKLVFADEVLLLQLKHDPSRRAAVERVLGADAAARFIAALESGELPSLLPQDRAERKKAEGTTAYHTREDGKSKVRFNFEETRDSNGLALVTISAHERVHAALRAAGVRGEIEAWEVQAILYNGLMSDLAALNQKRAARGQGPLRPDFRTVAEAGPSVPKAYELDLVLVYEAMQKGDGSHVGHILRGYGEDYLLSDRSDAMRLHQYVLGVAGKVRTALQRQERGGGETLAELLGKDSPELKFYQRNLSKHSRAEQLRMLDEHIRERQAELTRLRGLAEAGPQGTDALPGSGPRGDPIRRLREELRAKREGAGPAALERRTPAQALDVAAAAEGLAVGESRASRFTLAVAAQDAPRDGAPPRVAGAYEFEVRMRRASAAWLDIVVSDGHGTELKFSYEPARKLLTVENSEMQGPAKGQGLYSQIIRALGAQGVDRIESTIENKQSKAAIAKFRADNPDWKAGLPHSVLADKTTLGASRGKEFLLSLDRESGTRLLSTRVSGEVSGLLERAAALEKAGHADKPAALELSKELTRAAERYRDSAPELFSALHTQIAYLRGRAGAPIDFAETLPPAARKAEQTLEQRLRRMLPKGLVDMLPAGPNHEGSGVPEIKGREAPRKPGEDAPVRQPLPPGGAEIDALLGRVQPLAAAQRGKLSGEQLGELKAALDSPELAPAQREAIRALLSAHFKKLEGQFGQKKPFSDADLAALAQLDPQRLPELRDALSKLLQGQFEQYREKLRQAQNAGQPSAPEIARGIAAAEPLAEALGLGKELAFLRKMPRFESANGAVYSVLPERQGAPVAEPKILSFNAEHLRLPDASNPDAPAKTGDTPMQTLTRLGRVMKQLESADADIVALQEAGPVAHMRALLATHGLAEKYPNIVYFPPAQGQQGLLLLATSRVRIDPASLQSMMGAGRPAWGSMSVDLGGGRTLRLVTAHLKADPDPSLPEAEYKKQMEQKVLPQRQAELAGLNELLAKQPGTPTVILGDFNTTAKVEIPGLSELPASRPTHVGGALDRAFLSRGLAVRGNEVLGERPSDPKDPNRTSDHLPRLITLTEPPPKPSEPPGPRDPPPTRPERAIDTLRGWWEARGGRRTDEEGPSAKQPRPGRNLEALAGKPVPGGEIEGGAGGAETYTQMTGRLLRGLRSADIAPEMLPYLTGLRPAGELRLPALFEGVAAAKVARMTDIVFASKDHSGSIGLVRLAYLADGTPVAIKTEYPRDQPGKPTPAETLKESMFQEARSAKLLSDLGIGPRFHGMFLDADGRWNVVMDIVPGDFLGKPAGKTLADVETMIARLRRAGIQEIGDFQFFRLPGGGALAIDPAGAADSIGRKPTHAPDSRHGFATRQRMQLLADADPAVGKEYLDRLRRDDPAAWRGVREAIADNLRDRNDHYLKYADYLREHVPAQAALARIAPLLTDIRGKPLKEGFRPSAEKPAFLDTKDLAKLAELFGDPAPDPKVKHRAPGSLGEVPAAEGRVLWEYALKTDGDPGGQGGAFLFLTADGKLAVAKVNYHRKGRYRDYEVALNAAEREQVELRTAADFMWMHNQGIGPGYLGIARSDGSVAHVMKLVPGRQFETARDPRARTMLDLLSIGRKLERRGFNELSDAQGIVTPDGRVFLIDGPGGRRDPRAPQGGGLGPQLLAQSGLLKRASSAELEALLARLDGTPELPAVREQVDAVRRAAVAALFKDYPGLAADLKKAADTIAADFKPDQYAYVGVGRSPTGVVAMLQAGGRDARGLPLSEFYAGAGQPALSPEARANLWAHLERNLPSAAELKGRKLLLMDYSENGKSMSAFKPHLEAFLAERRPGAKAEFLIFSPAEGLSAFGPGKPPPGVHRLPVGGYRNLFTALRFSGFDELAPYGSFKAPFAATAPASPQNKPLVDFLRGRLNSP